jgi:4-amino-4-deoxy-L-arabinose transferase-like glycosyltransferase
MVLVFFALAIAIVARILLADIIRRTPEKALWPDSGGYVTLARAIADGRAYRDPEGSSIDLMRPPGYPLWLAGFFRAFGEDFFAVVVGQLALGVAASLLIWAEGSRVAGERTGQTAAILYVLTPNAILWGAAILSDGLLVFLVTLAFVCVARHLRGRGASWALLSGVFIGLGAMARPVALVLIVVWPAVILAAGLTGHTRIRRSRLAALLFAAGALSIVVPWAYRNSMAYRVFMFSSIDTLKLGRYDAPYTLAHAEGITLEEARERIPTSRVPQPGDRARYLAILLEHPLDFIYVHARGTWYVLTEAGQPNVAQLVGERYQTAGVGEALRRGALGEALERLTAALGDPQRRWFVIAPWTAIVFQTVVYLAAAWGAVRAARSTGALRVVAILAALTALAFLLVPGSVGTGRFRLPAEPFLSLLAGIGLAGVRPIPEEQGGVGPEDDRNAARPDG